jgi:Ca2+-binding EF-hand superfamily protein
MMKKTLVTTVCAIAIATPVFAGERHGGQKHHRGEKFEEADANGDGKLSLEEFKTAREEKLEQRFKKTDADGDGFVTKEEMKAAHERFKQRRDDDKAEDAE